MHKKASSINLHFQLFTVCFNCQWLGTFTFTWIQLLITPTSIGNELRTLNDNVQSTLTFQCRGFTYNCQESTFIFNSQRTAFSTIRDRKLSKVNVTIQHSLPLDSKLISKRPGLGAHMSSYYNIRYQCIEILDSLQIFPGSLVWVQYKL